MPPLHRATSDPSTSLGGTGVCCSLGGIQRPVRLRALSRAADNASCIDGALGLAGGGGSSGGCALAGGPCGEETVRAGATTTAAGRARRRNRGPDKNRRTNTSETSNNTHNARIAGASGMAASDSTASLNNPTIAMRMIPPPAFATEESSSFPSLTGAGSNSGAHGSVTGGARKSRSPRRTTGCQVPLPGNTK